MKYLLLWFKVVSLQFYDLNLFDIFIKSLKLFYNMWPRSKPIFSIMYSTKYTVNCTQYTVNSTQHTVNCTQYTVNCTHQQSNTKRLSWKKFGCLQQHSRGWIGKEKYLNCKHKTSYRSNRAGFPRSDWLSLPTNKIF